MNKYLIAAMKREDTAENLSRYERQQELLKRMINNFATDLVVKSMADEEAANADIEKLKGLTSQSKTDNYNNNKEKKNGI